MSTIFFETDAFAAKLQISSDDYESLKASVRAEFPDDEMMYQLHLLRAIRSLTHKSPAATSK